MNDHQQRDLARGLAALAESTRHLQAGTKVEAAVLAEMGSAGGFTPRLLPLAAALILSVGGALWMARSVADHPHVAYAAGFVALPDAAWLPALESANIVRVSLPVAALPAYGFPVVDLKGDSVEAELLVAQDGQARAIRFVHDSD